MSPLSIIVGGLIGALVFVAYRLYAEAVAENEWENSSRYDFDD